MKKKCYYAPMAKVVELRAKSLILSSGTGQDEDDADFSAKGSTLFFDEDED